VIVSIGANEMHWTQLMELVPGRTAMRRHGVRRMVLPGARQLHHRLLRPPAAIGGAARVAAGHRQRVLRSAPMAAGLRGRASVTAAKSAVLTSRLGTFNTVLADGAASFGFDAVAPSFAGHELCTQQSFVQGLNDGARCIPTRRERSPSRLADEEALLNPDRPDRPVPRRQLLVGASPVSCSRMSERERPARAVTVAGFAVFLLLGVVIASYGPSIPHITQRFHVTVSIAGPHRHRELSRRGHRPDGARPDPRPMEARPAAHRRNRCLWRRTARRSGGADMAAGPPRRVRARIGAGGLVVLVNLFYATRYGRRSPAMLGLVNTAYGVAPSWARRWWL